MKANLSLLKELLQRRTQVKFIMARDPHCICIEAAIALSCGATIEQKQNQKYFVHLQGIALEGEIEEDLFPVNLPRLIDREILVQHYLALNLSCEQIQKIKKLDDLGYTWNYLNDVLGFSFEQFQTLIDIVGSTHSNSEHI